MLQINSIHEGLYRGWLPYKDAGGNKKLNHLNVKRLQAKRCRAHLECLQRISFYELWSDSYKSLERKIIVYARTQNPPDTKHLHLVRKVTNLIDWHFNKLSRCVADAADVLFFRHHGQLKKLEEKYGKD